MTSHICSVEGCKNTLSREQEGGLFPGMCKAHREDAAWRRLRRMGKVTEARTLPGCFEMGKRR